MVVKDIGVIMKRFSLFVYLAVVCLFSSSAYADQGRIFINGGAYSGKAGAEVTYERNGAEIASVESDESGTGLVVSIGSINDKRMALVEASTMEYSDARILSVLAVYNHFIGGTDKLKPYAGVHGGFSSFTWKEDIVLDGYTYELKDESATSGALGVRAGLIARINETFMIDFGYKYTATALETDLELSASDTLKFESKYNHGAYVTLNCIF